VVGDQVLVAGVPVVEHPQGGHARGCGALELPALRRAGDGDGVERDADVKPQ
jgi:hypothetical protein